MPTDDTTGSKAARGTCASTVDLYHDGSVPHERLETCDRWTPDHSTGSKAACERIQRVYLEVQQQDGTHSGHYPCVCDLLAAIMTNTFERAFAQGWAKADAEGDARCKAEYERGRTVRDAELQTFMRMQTEAFERSMSTYREEGDALRAEVQEAIQSGKIKMQFPEHECPEAALAIAQQEIAALKDIIRDLDAQRAKAESRLAAVIAQSGDR